MGDLAWMPSRRTILRGVEGLGTAISRRLLEAASGLVKRSKLVGVV